ncbi:MAG: ligand-binding sensor domain-containing protein, partial [Kangiellaceae bacterium]
MSHLVLKLHVGFYIKLVLYFLLFFHFQPLIANKADYRYKKAFDIQKLSLEQGLSQSVVNAIAQDKNGFIWLATEDGLNRFDGYEFIVYQHDHKNKSSLHENWVTALSIQDNKGIWLGTVSGPSFFDFSTRKFTNYGQIFPIVNQHVRDVIFDKDSGLWVATYKGLFYRAIDSENDSPFLSIATRHFSKSHTKVISLTSSDEYIFASTDNCILRINKFSHETVDFCAGNKLSSLIKKSITTVYLENNNLWIGTESSGLYQYEINNDALHQYTTESLNGLAISSDYVQDIASHKDGSIWITTINGISIYDRNTHRFTQHTQSGLGKNQLSASDILSIFIDSSGLVWLGTYGRGVNLLNPNQQRFEHI